MMGVQMPNDYSSHFSRNGMFRAGFASYKDVHNFPKSFGDTLPPGLAKTEKDAGSMFAVLQEHIHLCAEGMG